MNSLPKYVVSTTLEKAEWNSSHLIKENVAEEILKVKQQPGQDILVAGSATLVQTLIQHDLIDEYHLLVYPVVVGGWRKAPLLGWEQSHPETCRNQGVQFRGRSPSLPA